MTDVVAPAPFEEPSARHGRGRIIAGVIAALVVLGIGAAIVLWWRGGGPRRVITDLAEEGAVTLADAVLDEVLPAA